MTGAMRVRDLIAELQKRDPESIVQTWDAYTDSATCEVYVSDMPDGATMICNADFGIANTVLSDSGERKET